ncbi:MAG: heme o synthase [Candidatus Acidiferrales bacterium]
MSTTRAEVMPALGKSWAYVALIKPDVTFLVVITTVAGFCLASSGPIEWLRLANTLLGTTLVAAGTAALNQYFERASDAKMRRTANRPLPLGQLQPEEALWFGTILIVAGAAYLVFCTNLLACLLALATTVFYLGAYTPLKKRTTLATAVGAFPGALPPLIGWAAATGSLSLGAWVLFGILFFWQFPHFMAIAWIYREDYSRAGIKMLPVVDPSGDATFSQIVGSAALLMIVSLLPSLVGMTSVRYFFSAVVMGMAFLQICLWANRSRTNVRAKWLMHATVIHIPLLLSFMLFDKFSR